MYTQFDVVYIVGCTLQNVHPLLYIDQRCVYQDSQHGIASQGNVYPVYCLI